MSLYMCGDIHTCIYLYLHVFWSTYVCQYMYAYACACLWRREVDIRYLPQLFFILFTKVDYLTNPSSLANQFAT